MLSPGDYYKSVPTDPAANLRFRRRVLTEAAHSKRLRAELIEACRRDIIFFGNVFVYQFNPKKFGDEVGPWIFFPRQEEVMRSTLDRLYGQRQAMSWEKSRYQGATWMLVIKDDWLSLFHKYKSFLMVSHTEDAVYKKDNPGSLFWKVEFIHRHLPDWLLRGAARETSKKTMTFHFPATGSFINGGANTERVGVGDRRSSVDLDEFAKQPNAADIRSQTADTGPQLFVSTHYGVGTIFYDITSAPGAVKEVMHWSQNPMQNAGLYRSDPLVKDHERPLDKTYEYPPDFQFVRDGKPHGGPFPGLRSPWYDTEVTERLRLGGDERDIAMHLDIDAQGSTFQFFSADRIKQLVRTKCRPAVARYDVRYDPDSCEVAGADELPSGLLWLWCNLDYKGRPPEGDYAIGCDLAAGTGATPTCFSVVNQFGEKVAAYADPRVEPSDAAPLAVALAKWFHGAFLVWEMPGPGLKFADKVLETRYSNIYWKPKNELQRIKQPSLRPGWWNDPKSATLLLRTYKAALFEGDFTNRDELAVAECLDYVFVDNSIEHTGRKKAKDDPSGAKDNHGDRVIADALAWLGIKDRVKRAEAETISPLLHPGSLAGRMAMAEAAEKAREVASWFDLRTG